jgi:hypothetical protein
MSKRSACLATLLAVAAATTVLAQQQERAPRGSAATSIGGKSVAVDYGRPALKGRSLETLMKDLPADRMWRAGEQQVTTVAFAGDVMIGGTRVPAGKYSVYVHAGEGNKWDLVLNKDLGVPLGKIWAGAPDAMKNEPWPYLQDYTGKIGAQEVARVPLKAGKPGTAADLFTISFAPAGTGSTMTLAWGDQVWTTEVTPAAQPRQ